eukprot:TRINITY_DN846_c0_g1_i6.p1 TRINITY_DN846_c0_g1~~TRINITY_DN846_c0_g1_i6.p1  ORF type:complete len:172 (-),score=10.65 TRINITY_DN846_c0_g1_i6:328-843(-)
MAPLGKLLPRNPTRARPLPSSPALPLSCIITATSFSLPPPHPLRLIPSASSPLFRSMPCVCSCLFCFPASLRTLGHSECSLCSLFCFGDRHKLAEKTLVNMHSSGVVLFERLLLEVPRSRHVVFVGFPCLCWVSMPAVPVMPSGVPVMLSGPSALVVIPCYVDIVCFSPRL